MKNRLCFTVVAMFLLATAFPVSCTTQGGAVKSRYVVSPVGDTLTILLPDCEDEFCKIKVYGNNAQMYASDYVVNGQVKFCVSTLPGGRHRVLIRAGDVLADESFVKR